ncbi:MAG: response regulator transcription factor [Solirubrobacteraceae bacterium]
MRVLVVEDQPKMSGLIVRGLTQQGIVADAVASGEEALWLAATARFDVLLVDVMLPGIDGFETCRRLRAEQVFTPVLMLTARSAVGDRVAGLDGGADDYMVKPFAFVELLARVRALARRPSQTRPPVLEVGDLRLDPAGRRAWRGQRELALSSKELLLLEAFMSRPAEVLSRLELLEAGWDHAYENRSNIIDAYVKRLRAKIDKPFGVRTLETVRGSGYRLSG